MKETKLDKVYAQFEKTYSNIPEEELNEELKKQIENLEKEIAGKEQYREALADEDKEKLDKNLEESKKKLQNLKGYSKNKKQIEFIKKFKGDIQVKLESEKQDKENNFDKLQKLETELEKIEEKLSDEKNTMMLDNNEYNSLQAKKSQLLKDISSYKNKIKENDKRILELQSKIGKCDLAWKTLFTNKTWDEIQRREAEPGKRYSKTSEKDIFMEGLRKRLDKDYKEEVVHKKEENQEVSKNEDQENSRKEKTVDEINEALRKQELEENLNAMNFGDSKEEEEVKKKKKFSIKSMFKSIGKLFGKIKQRIVERMDERRLKSATKLLLKSAEAGRESRRFDEDIKMYEAAQKIAKTSEDKRKEFLDGLSLDIDTKKLNTAIECEVKEKEEKRRIRGVRKENFKKFVGDKAKYLNVKNRVQEHNKKRAQKRIEKYQSKIDAINEKYNEER